MDEEQSNPSVGELAARYRALAAELRARARLMSRHDLRKKFLRYAKIFEDIARQEEQARGKRDA